MKKNENRRRKGKMGRDKQEERKNNKNQRKEEGKSWYGIIKYGHSFGRGKEDTEKSI